MSGRSGFTISVTPLQATLLTRAPLNVLSEILGHTNIAVTAKVYVHLYGRQAAEDQFRAAMAQ